MDRDELVMRSQACPGWFMKLVFRALLTAWLLFAVSVVRADIPDAKIEQFMALSGIGEMLESMPGQIESLIDQLVAASANPEQERKLMQALADAWSPAAVRASVEDFIRQSSDAAEIDRLLQWKVSPLAKKMMAVELASYAPTFQEDFGRFMAGLEANPPDEETSQAIGRLVMRAHLADMMVESMVQATEAMAVALVNAGMVDNEEAVAGLRAQLDSMRAQLQPRMQRRATLLSLYIYRDVSNAELDEYSAFYASDLGKRELALAYGSLEVALSQWVNESAGALVADR